MISRGWRFYSLFMAAATFFLVIAGGLVTSTGSALAVPDWPLSFGQLFPPMIGGVFYEHGHRMVAATIGLFTIVLAAGLSRQDREPLLKKAVWIALGLVCVQGVLGGVTVLLKLPLVTSVGHACLGQIFFAWMTCIAAMAWSTPLVQGLGSELKMHLGAKLDLTPDVHKLRCLSLMTTGFVFFQLLIGAIYRHSGMLLHVHFLGALLVFVHGLLLFKRVEKTASGDPWFSRPAMLLVSLIVVQVGLGLCTWQYPTVLDATTHVAVGALILATSAVLSLQSFRRMAA